MAESDVASIKSGGVNSELENAIKLSNCLGLKNSGVSTNIAKADYCVSALKDASRNGWIRNVPLIALAIQQEPYVKDGRGSDSAANKSLAIMDKVFDLSQNPAEDKSKVSYICTASTGRNCASVPITAAEMDAAVIGTTTPSAQMNSHRALPVDKAGAAMMAFADAQMNMDRYLDEGKTLQDTVARIRSTTADDVIQAALKLCTANQAVPESKTECASRGAQAGLIEALNTGVRYRGSEFMGSKPTLARK